MCTNRPSVLVVPIVKPKFRLITLLEVSWSLGTTNHERHEHVGAIHVSTKHVTESLFIGIHSSAAPKNQSAFGHYLKEKPGFMYIVYFPRRIHGYNPDQAKVPALEHQNQFRCSLAAEKHSLI